MLNHYINLVISLQFTYSAIGTPSWNFNSAQCMRMLVYLGQIDPGWFFEFLFLGENYTFLRLSKYFNTIKMFNKAKITMPLNEKDVQGWTVDSLRNYLTTRCRCMERIERRIYFEKFALLLCWIFTKHHLQTRNVKNYTRLHWYWRN